MKLRDLFYIKCEIPNCKKAMHIFGIVYTHRYGKYAERTLVYCSDHTKKEMDKHIKKLEDAYGKRVIPTIRCIN